MVCWNYFSRNYVKLTFVPLLFKTDCEVMEARTYNWQYVSIFVVPVN